MTQVVSANNSSTFLYTVSDKTTRADGNEVYLIEIKYSFLLDSVILDKVDTLYHTLSEGYLVVTNLNSDSEGFPGIPFSEHRLAITYPALDDTCWQTSSVKSFIKSCS